ncbi:MAG TPA: rhodanese-like domain-containing protein [Vicinamibacterales bacterium]|nr:rhodanese-like domain-containing protein [Vicinamibacterales bacterium]
MFIKRLFETKLAQASYVIGCQATGEAMVIDPNRDADLYIRTAEAEGLKITHVTETHIHADFVSGSRELAARTGARLYLSDEGDANWKYTYVGEDGATLVKDGDRITVGNVLVDIVHTPGHTPEHIVFLITDSAGANAPIAVASGDFIFVGDVGRPDLLEKAANIKGTMELGARQLYASLQKFASQPDWLQVWPGHGAGSSCGKGISAIPHSTLGYERRFNWAFQAKSEADFVAAVLAGQPEPPKYFAEMKRVNKEGPRILNGFKRPEQLQADALESKLREKAVVVDTRKAAAFAVGHVPGTISIPLNASFTTWAGWLLPYDRDFYLIVDGPSSTIDAAARDLAMIGLDKIAGYFDASVIDAWAADERPLETLPHVTVQDLQASLGHHAVTLLDVRNQNEWNSGHIDGAQHITLGYLADHLAEIPREKPIVLHCEGGGRSSIGASVLKAHGFDNVINLTGGMGAWRKAGLPVER